MSSKRRVKTFDLCIKSILFLFIIFCPVIKFLPKYSWALAFLGMATLTNNDFRRKIGFCTKQNLLLLLMLSMNVALLGFGIPIVHLSNDYSYVPLLIAILLSIFRCILLAFIVYRTDKEKPLDCFIKIFLNACCIYVGFTILFIVFPSFKSFWLYSVLENVTENDYYAYQFRYSFDGFAAFSSSSMFAYASLLAGYVIAKRQKYEFTDLLRLIICIIGCFFYGRIALVGIILGVGIIITNNNSSKKILQIVWRGITIVILLVMMVNYLATINDSFLYWKNWAFAIVEQLFSGEGITDYSVIHMFEDMYYVPEDIKTILIGDGLYTSKSGGYYGNTDVGFMRILLYSGLFGLVLSYATLFYCVFLTRLKSDSKLTTKFLWCFVVLFVVLECKGESYHRMLTLLYPLLLMLTYEHRHAFYYADIRGGSRK